MRRRLSIWVSVFLSGALLVSGVAMYSYYRSQLLKGVDDRMIRAASNIVAAIAKNPRRFSRDPQRYIFTGTRNEYTSGSVLVQFMSLDGELTARSPGLVNFFLPFSLGEDDVIKDIEIDDGTKLKIYQRLIVIGERKMGYVVVGQPVTQAYHNLEILRNIIIVITVLSVVILGSLISALVSKNVMSNHRRFLSFASHELRTPLAIIIGNADIALKSKNLEDYETAVTVIRDEAEWMKRLVANLLLIFRSQAGSEIIIPGHFDLSELMLEEVGSLKRRFPDKTIDIQLPNTSDCYADPDKIRQVIRNLLDNAAKYSPSGGLISISATTHKSKTSVTVKDNGHGMDPSTQKHIFDAYYRLNYTDIEGAGLGLAIVKSIIDAHHGKIHITSTVGKGTEFRVEFPHSSIRRSRSRQSQRGHLLVTPPLERSPEPEKAPT